MKYIILGAGVLAVTLITLVAMKPVTLQMLYYGTPVWATVNRRLEC